MIKKIGFFIFFIIALADLLAAQSKQALFKQMIQAFQQLKFENAEQFAKQITADYEAHTPFELLEAHKILGAIAYQRDLNLIEATNQFEHALSIDHTTQLDSSGTISPKTIQFFNEVKLKFISVQQQGETGKQLRTRYIIQPDRRPGAILRSMVLPGWGQFYKQDIKKGYIIAVATTSLVLTTITFHFLQNKAHDEYLNTTEPALMADKYDRYNQFYQLRNNAALLSGGIWLYAFFDALITKPKVKPDQLKISLQLNSESPSLLVAARFSF